MAPSPAKPPSLFVDLTADDDDDDDSLSELSDPGVSASRPASPTKAKPKPPSKQTPKQTPSSSATSTLKKSASSSSIAPKPSSQNGTAAKPASKPKARKSEPIPATAAAASSSSRSAPISDVVRARTHVNAEGQPQKLCHQHHQPCKGALLECTFMRAPGKRCQGRYCFASLRRFYDQDAETIVKSNRMMVNPAEHCPPSEAKYAWKCPRCRGKCACSTCRKAAGLEPLGRWSGGARTSTAADASAEKPSKGKAKAQHDSSTKGAKGAKPKDRTLAEAVAAAHKNAAKPKSKAKAKPKGAEDGDVDDGIRTPPPPGSKPAPKNNTLASILSGTARAPAASFKVHKPPAEVAPPAFELIETKLPEANLRARMWIYESMVRFDKFGLSRSVLSQLDRFEHWTHAMAQEMLGCLLKTIAGLGHVDKGQPTKPYAKAITSFRAHGKSLQRGEPWSAATELLALLGLTRMPLPYVEHDVPVEVEAAAAERSPSPPMARVTRARRAKENRQYDMARQLSLLDEWEAEEFGEAANDDADDDDDDAPRARRTRGGGGAKKSIYVYDDASDDESMADPDDDARGRRSGRARNAPPKAATPEVRLTGRQQAIRLQQEQQKEEQAARQEQQAQEAEAAAQEEQEEQAAKKGARKRTKPSRNHDSDSDSALSDVSDDDAERTQRKKRRMVVSSDGEDTDAADTKVSSEADEVDEVSTSGLEREMESPDLETKVSILSALIDAAVMSEAVAEELKQAAESIVGLERSHRVEQAEMEKELAEEVAELGRRAPSIVSREYQRWKAEKVAMEEEHARRRIEARVVAELAIDTHALRTGALGCDVDGREFWHLREYQERMPKHTQGRYAWCVVVLGPTFPIDPNQVADGADETTDTQANGDASTAAAQPDRLKDESDDSGLTSLDEGSECWPSKHEDGMLGLAVSSKATGAKSSAGEVGGEVGQRVCMGANSPSTIKALIEYTMYRLERVEYEENVAMQDRERRAALAKAASESIESTESTESTEGGGSGASAWTKAEGGESVQAVRKAKQLLKDAHDERRKQVEQLVKRLHKSKEYFAWHREEPAP